MKISNDKTIDITDIIIFLSSILITIFSMFVTDIGFLKSLFIFISLLILYFLYKSKMKLHILFLVFLGFVIICSMVIASDNNPFDSTTRGSYTLSLFNAINKIQTSGDIYKDKPDNEFLVKKGILINQDTKVRYDFAYQIDQELTFLDVPTGIYLYEIEFENIDLEYIHDSPIEITSGTLINPNEKNDYIYINI